jgi:hypothetical protein
VKATACWRFQRAGFSAVACNVNRDGLERTRPPRSPPLRVVDGDPDALVEWGRLPGLLLADRGLAHTTSKRAPRLDWPAPGTIGDSVADHPGGGPRTATQTPCAWPFIPCAIQSGPLLGRYAHQWCNAAILRRYAHPWCNAAIPNPQAAVGFSVVARGRHTQPAWIGRSCVTG